MDFEKSTWKSNHLCTVSMGKPTFQINHLLMYGMCGQPVHTLELPVGASPRDVFKHQMVSPTPSCIISSPNVQSDMWRLFEIQNFFPKEVIFLPVQVNHSPSKRELPS